MRPSPQRARDLAVIAGCVVVASVCAWLLRDVRNDDAYITYRYAQNLLAGRGFVFNPGEDVLATTAPGHGLLVALFGTLVGDIVVGAHVLSWSAAIVLAWCLYTALRDLEMPWPGAWAAGAVLVSPSTYDLFPLETITVSALVLVALRLAMRERAVALGVVAGLAVTIRADAALFFIALIPFARGIDRRKIVATIVAAVAVALPWLVFAGVRYGHPLPSPSATKTGWPGHTWTYLSRAWERGLVPLFGVELLTALAVPIAVLGIVVLVRDRRLGFLRAVPLWMLLHATAYSALRILWPHHWYYHPITIGFAVCIAVGAQAILTRATKMIRAALAAVAVATWGSGVVELVDLHDRIPTEFFLGGRDRLYQSAAAWLQRETKAEDRIALAEPGTLAYYSDRTMIDTLGLVTPAIGVAIKERGQLVDVPWLVEHYAPEYLVLIPNKIEPMLRTLPDAPQYTLRATFDAEGVDRRVVIYGR